MTIIYMHNPDASDLFPVVRLSKASAHVILVREEKTSSLKD